MLEEKQLRLNYLLKGLKTAVNTDAPHDEYEKAVFAAAETLYANIKQTCEDGFEVWAHKNDGRILKIGRVGDIQHTRFPYSRFPRVEPDDKCELVVIGHIEVKEAQIRGG
jgi:hypothetical protein